jgi:hypothetical protein
MTDAALVKAISRWCTVVDTRHIDPRATVMDSFLFRNGSDKLIDDSKVIIIIIMVRLAGPVA